MPAHAQHCQSVSPSAWRVTLSERSRRDQRTSCGRNLRLGGSSSSSSSRRSSSRTALQRCCAIAIHPLALLHCQLHTPRSRTKTQRLSALGSHLKFRYWRLRNSGHKGIFCSSSWIDEGRWRYPEGCTRNTRSKGCVRVKVSWSPDPRPWRHPNMSEDATSGLRPTRLTCAPLALSSEVF